MANWWEVGDVVQAPRVVQQDQVASNSELNKMRAEAKSAREVRRMGDEFLGYNYGKKTGGLDDFLFPPWMQPKAQAMEGLTSKMLNATRLPGTSGEQNTGKEQETVMARLPNRKTGGRVNKDRGRGLQEDEFLRYKRVEAAERWVAQNGSLDEFEAQWGRMEPTVRQGFKYVEPPKREPGRGVVPQRPSGGGLLGQFGLTRPVQARRKYNQQTGKIE